MAVMTVLQLQAGAEGRVELGIVDLAAQTGHLPTTKTPWNHTIHLSGFAISQFEKWLALLGVLVDAADSKLSTWCSLLRTLCGRGVSRASANHWQTVNELPTGA